MCQIPIEPKESIDFLDISFKSATILIALFNVYFATKVFNFKNKKDDNEKESDRKIQLLKTIILDHNLKNFYSIFDEIDIELNKLKTPNLTDEEKGTIDSSVADLFIKLRRKFYDPLLAIENNLYDTIKANCDELQSNLSNVIFDQGINLSHLPKYEDSIDEKLTVCKTKIVQILFTYRGGNS